MKKREMERAPDVTILFAEGKPHQAFNAIRAAYQKHQKRSEVAKALNAKSVSTLRRWIDRLVEMGLGDPRDGVKVASVGRGGPVRDRELTAADYREMKRRRTGKNKETLAKIAADFGVSISLVARATAEQK